MDNSTTVTPAPVSKGKKTATADFLLQTTLRCITEASARAGVLSTDNGLPNSIDGLLETAQTMGINLSESAPFSAPSEYVNGPFGAKGAITYNPDHAPKYLFPALLVSITKHLVMESRDILSCLLRSRRPAELCHGLYQAISLIGAVQLGSVVEANSDEAAEVLSVIKLLSVCQYADFGTASN